MRVVINADDFGASERHSRLILELLQKGRISSTTFLVGLDYSEAAAELLKNQAPELVSKIGLHFNLIEGRPLNPDLLATPFVDANQHFKDFRGRVSKWQQLRHLGRLRKELDLQIDRFHALLGRYPTHLDSHGHTHCTWVMLLALLFSKQAGKIPAVRLTRQYDHEPTQMKGMRNRIRRLAKKILNGAFRIRFRTVDYFTDIRNMDRTWLTEEALAFLAQRFDAIEIMCHPYLFDETEYEFLAASPNLFDQSPVVQLVGYGEIWV